MHEPSMSPIGYRIIILLIIDFSIKSGMYINFNFSLLAFIVVCDVQKHWNSICLNHISSQRHSKHISTNSKYIDWNRHNPLKHLQEMPVSFI